MDRISGLKRNELLKELKSYKKYQYKTQKSIGEKLATIDNIRNELRRLEDMEPKLKKSLNTEDKQYMSAKQVLSTILLNSDTNKILDEYIISYLKMNPHLVTQYLDENGLYYVYFRKQDTNTNPDIGYDNEPMLLKAFGTQKEAEKWILEHGNDIVTEQEENYDSPIVLMIIYDKNEGVIEPGHTVAYGFGISDKMYPTYAFSKEGYKMLKKELKYNSMGYDREDKGSWIHNIK